MKKKNEPNPSRTGNVEIWTRQSRCNVTFPLVNGSACTYIIFVFKIVSAVGHFTLLSFSKWTHFIRCYCRNASILLFQRRSVSIQEANAYILLFQRRSVFRQEANASILLFQRRSVFRQKANAFILLFQKRSVFRQEANCLKTNLL